MALPGGEQFEIAAGAVRAVVTEVGASLRVLEHDGRPLVRPWDEHELRPAFSGAVLAPWPNRLADGRYTWQGTTYQVAITEPETMTALHGLVAWERWEVRRHGPAYLTLGHRLVPETGYPFPLDLEMTYEAVPDGLQLQLRARNTGDAAAPYGCSIHPYLVGGEGTVDDWTLRLPAGDRLRLDPDRQLPHGRQGLGDVDFRAGRSLADAHMDDAFTEVEWRDGTASAEVRGADGGGVLLTWDRACGWLQVFTGDHPLIERTGIAVEPMTCPPNAFATGDDVITLDGGADHTTSWRFSALRAG